MLKGISKTVVILSLAIAVVSCGDSEKAGALELYNQAQTQIDSGNYKGALVLLDTLASRYPAQTQIRRDGLRLRAMAMEGSALDSIGPADAALADATIRVQEWAPKFEYIKSSVGLEGYFLPKGVDCKVMTATGLQARVSDKGLLYYVVNVQGRRIGLDSFSFASGGSEISSQNISELRIISVEGSESASFNPEETEDMAAWLEAHPGSVKVIFSGSKGRAEIKMSDKLRNEILDCYHYSRAMQDQRLASLRREKLERMLQVARDQLANMPVPEK